MNKGIYTIGYKDSYGSFTKIWLNGSPRRFETQEECEKFIQTLPKGTYKIMAGWKVKKEVKNNV